MPLKQSIQPQASGDQRTQKFAADVAKWMDTRRVGMRITTGAEVAGVRRAMYEPIHGSAPDIAGRDCANPLATILSAGMMFRYSFGWAEAADKLDAAVKQVLSDGIRTADIAIKGQAPVGTAAMGQAVIAALSKML